MQLIANMFFIEGIGQEVILAICIGILSIICLFLFYLRHRVRGTLDENMSSSSSEEDRPPVFNPGNCPICMALPTFGIETNCGHLYCGDCFITYHARRFNGMPLNCPMCRQRIGLLFDCFTHEERMYPDNVDTFQNITSFIRNYNRMMTNDLTIWERLREIPILLRHFATRLLEGEQFFTLWMRVRVFLYFSFVLLYILLPYDLVPEFVYGIAGYIEDAIIVVFVLFYFALLYRNMIADNN